MKWINLFLLFFCFSAFSKTAYITILHTNDHHGRFYKNKHGEYGLAARKTLIDKLRLEAHQQKRIFLLLSGGDINTGIPESDMLKAEPDFKGMRLLKYDAMAVGNHEFDNSLETIFKQQRWAGFPFLSANIFYKKPVGGLFGFFTKKRPFKPYIIRKFKNFKIGIMGFTTTDTPQKVNPKHLNNIEFRSPVKVAKEILPELKKKTDMIIAVSHMGHFDNGEHGFDAPGDVTLARSVSGIDLIVGGHTQKALFEPDLQNKTIIVQAYEWGKFVGKLDLKYENGKVTIENYKLVPINLKKKITLKDGSEQRVFIDKEIKEDPQMLKFIKPYLKIGAKKLDQVVGETKVFLNGARKITTREDTELSKLLNKAFLEVLNADISIMNSGGIRASIDIGKITYRDLMKVLPFGGTLVQVKMTGSELKEYLRKLIFTQPKGTNGYPHFAGLDYSVREEDLVNIKIQNETLDPKKIYKLVLPIFLAHGGDKYPDLKNHPAYLDTGLTDVAVVKAYLEQQNLK